MANETIMLSEELGIESTNPQELDDVVEEQCDEASGLFFRVETGSNTFCIRGVPTQSLDDGVTKIHDGDREILKRLKVDSNEALNSLKFFETDSFGDAEKVVRQIANRRFPYDEELLCNLSDPGPYWWMDLAGESCNVYFTTNRIDRGRDLINLGPIGDPRIASLKFRESAKIIGELFLVDEFSCSEKFLTIKSLKNRSERFSSFVDIFRTGEFESSLRDQILELGGYDICEYLHGLALARKFWIEISELYLTKYR